MLQFYHISNAYYTYTINLKCMSDWLPSRHCCNLHMSVVNVCCLPLHFSEQSFNALQKLSTNLTQTPLSSLTFYIYYHSYLFGTVWILVTECFGVRVYLFMVADGFALIKYFLSIEVFPVNRGCIWLEPCRESYENI